MFLVEFNIEKLYNMVEEYLISEADYHAEVLNKPKYDSVKGYAYNAHKESVWQNNCYCKEQVAKSELNMIYTACEAAGIVDIGMLISSVKSIQRHEKKINWQRCYSLKDKHLPSFVREAWERWNRNTAYLYHPWPIWSWKHGFIEMG